MSKNNKFGAFGGVFTPSVLTILGVIMYLRLGWVVGQAGIIFTLLIILGAHFVSITTGLSVSSVATDRKVKAGGLYYMLSRSLGLPIGGSIGITLFVGTALSISMYIVGFSESFNDAIGFVGNTPEARMMNLRITGSLTLFLITTVALISTSFAIKTQYYIMAFIALSIVSIVVGLVFYNDPSMDVVDLQVYPKEGNVSLAVVFAIFFPAVTGFTAGVAMSGDLKDPKKAIPIGTIASIAVGLVVYIALAVLIAFYLDDSELRADKNILKRVTWLVRGEFADSPYLLYAGIWGATLSSALGGILGGPRILQAMSVDKVTPTIFSKGVGASNEPRNALILTFFIAEGGVLIGKLDAIAPIVTVFYLSAYGFINLTSALESWTGSDFRPSFKIPRIISISGAIVTFGFMFWLNFYATIIAFFIMGLIFFWLTKKQINLGFSNIWQGVWAEIVRVGLFRIDETSRKSDKKNWRPNILLFSGDKSRRPHLVDFGKGLVGRLGVVSSFELEEREDTNVPLTRAEQSIETGSGFTGMFFRKYKTSNVYDGIRTIAETYGFSGIEPNIVLLGWARYANSPGKFTQLLRRFNEMDYNVLLMDYDERYGFGKYRHIDIWWEGKGSHISFALTMARFLITDDAWLNSKVRLFIFLDKSQINSTEIYQNMEEALEELRVYAEVKIVDNEHGEKDLYDAIEIESNQADLIYVELPEISEENEAEFYEETNELCREIGTVVLYRGSSHFETIEIGLNQEVRKRAIQTIGIAEEHRDTSYLVLPQDSHVGEYIQDFHIELNQIITELGKLFFQPIMHENVLLVESIKNLIQVNLTRLKRIEDGDEKFEMESLMSMLHSSFVKVEKLLRTYGGAKTKAEANNLYKGIIEVNRNVKKLNKNIPKNVVSTFDSIENFSEEKLSQFTIWQRFKGKRFGKKVSYSYKLRKYFVEWFRQNGLELARDMSRKFTEDTVDYHEELEKIIRQFGAILQDLERQVLAEELDLEIIHKKTDLLFEQINDLVVNDQTRFDSYIWSFKKQLQLELQNSAYSIDKFDLSLPKTKKFGWVDQLKSIREEILAMPQVWAHNQKLFSNMHFLDLALQEFQIKFETVVKELQKQFNESLQGNIIFDLKKMKVAFENFADDQNTEIPVISRSDLEDNFQYQQIINEFLGDLEWLVGDLPQEIEVLSVESIQHPKTGEVADLESVRLSPLKIINYIVQTNFTETLVSETSELNLQVIQANGIIEDVERVIAVSIRNVDKSEFEEGSERREEFKNLVATELGRVSSAFDELVEMQASIGKVMEKNLGDTTEKLTTYGLVKEADNLDSFLRTQTRRVVFNVFSKRWEQAKDFVQNSVTELRYQKADSLASFAPNSHKKNKHIIPELLNFYEKVAPNKTLLDSLPFYYKQLFVKEQSASMELWYNREEELQIADRAVKRHFEGISGAILVTGEPDEGKSFLSEKIAHSYFEPKKIFVVNPPEGGDASLKTFRMAVNKAVGKVNMRLDTIFNRMPESSVVVFHDVELWWENLKGGSEVIDRFDELIDEHSDKCLMILNMNQFTYQYFQKLGKFDGDFMEIITCLPMGARALKDIIMLRHKSSHLRFRFEGKLENELTDWEMAGLFTKYFRETRGNIGFALQEWLSNIDVIEKSEITIHEPKNTDSDVLKRLPQKWFDAVEHFILHKKMLPSKFARLNKLGQEEADHFIKSMLRSQLIVEQNGVLEINRYFMPYLIKEFETEIGDEPWEEHGDTEVISIKKNGAVKKDHSAVVKRPGFRERVKAWVGRG
ncbi:MAG: amino acid transporter [Flammeovirgaceae bacterium]|jgi:amino acid transporter